MDWTPHDNDQHYQGVWAQTACYYKLVCYYVTIELGCLSNRRAPTALDRALLRALVRGARHHVARLNVAVRLAAARSARLVPLGEGLAHRDATVHCPVPGCDACLAVCWAVAEEDPVLGRKCLQDVGGTTMGVPCVV
jgi:hypothetical protein